MNGLIKLILYIRQLFTKSENKAPLSETQKKRIEQLKSRPRRRPDWSDMMKEVEQGKKLRHVQCNDRSAPIISVVKKDAGDEGEKFVFESEKKDVDAVHNALLSEIQQGVKLRKVKVNDRSKPNLSGKLAKQDPHR
ncbi:actobindin-B/C-like [Diaphorina citri]|uniref:Actobindin-B/C-like n=1 Tax=Diaphorina citri TaxID=121845 RepID=A0A3Q0J7Z4_DIACI|nr:actobindin-B/C-like [Diaphorina citri]